MTPSTEPPKLSHTAKLVLSKLLEDEPRTLDAVRRRCDTYTVPTSHAGKAIRELMAAGLAERRDTGFVRVPEKKL